MNDTLVQPKFVLASGSPRRRMLLAAAGLNFAVVESRLPERRRPEEDGERFALRMAERKAWAVSRRLPEALVLGADTVVECAGEILGKPKDDAEARRMLQKLSARSHLVFTAFALARAGEVVESHTVRSTVTFRSLGDEEIDSYIASGEPFDKAGGYGVQGHAGEFIQAVDGARDNVMGLPTREVFEALRRHGISC